MSAQSVFPASTLLRVISRLVPSWRRSEWLAEWRAEIEHAWVESRRQGRSAGLARLRLALRALDSIPDAFWLRRRDHGGDGWFWSVRDAARSLRRRPGFALAVIGTLALGMGSATAIYTIMDGLMLRPIPFSDPERLVSVNGSRGSPYLQADEMRVWREQKDLFDARAHAGRSFILTGAGEARSYRAELVEAGYLDLLGVRPLLGRDFSADEARGDGDGAVLLISFDVWSEAFGRDPAAIGRTVELDGDPHTIIGVLPPTLRVAPGGIVHLMLPFDGESVTRGLYLIARLRDGVTVEAANARLATLGAVRDREQPREGGWAANVTALERGLDPEVAAGFWTLGAAVSCLLLIACANAAGLFFLRGVARRPEVALRVALGSSRASLVRHVFAESMLLALAAGLLGTAFAWLGVRALRALIPSTLIRFSYTPVGVDDRVLAFAFALTLATGLLFGVLPALRTTSTIAARAGRAATASRKEVRVRGMIQVGQLGLAVLLLAGAGLFGRSFLSMLSVPLGYDVDSVLELELVSLEGLRGDPDAASQRAAELDTRLAALPGVTGVGRSGGMGIRFDYEIVLEDGSNHASGADVLPFVDVDIAYFHVMGIEMLEGRGFRAEDMLDGASSVVVDRDFAARFWPGRSAVGRRFRLGEERWLTVVGVTADVKLEGPLEPYGPLMMFHPADARRLRSGVVTIRTEGEPEALLSSVRALVRELDPDQPIYRLRTGRAALGDTMADPRFLLVIMSVFAGVAVLLASIGVYGLVSFTVAQRTREIGVRIALGARATRVVREVVGWGLMLGAVGVALGLGAAALLSRTVAALLFGISPLDPIALLAAGGSLLAACAAALVLPARRAATVQPVEALRVD